MTLYGTEPYGTFRYGETVEEREPIYPIPKPDSVDIPDAGMIHEWLTAEGFDVRGVSVGADGTLAVDSDDDLKAISAKIQAYDGSKPQRLIEDDARRADARLAIAAIKEIPPRERTMEQRAILGIASKLSMTVDISSDT